MNERKKKQRGVQFKHYCHKIVKTHVLGAYIIPGKENLLQEGAEGNISDYSFKLHLYSRAFWIEYIVIV